MKQAIVCKDQNKCKWYLEFRICDTCSRNENERTDNFAEFKAKSITITNGEPPTNFGWSI